MAWEDKTCVKKGNYGEQLCDNFLISHGVTPYLPSQQWCRPHPFDRLCALGKKKLYIVECKTKEARIYFPDTGIDIKHYKEYLHISKKYGMPIYLFFIDKDAGAMYGSTLENLEIPRVITSNTYTKIKNKGINYKPVAKRKKPLQYPFVKNGIRYWPLEAMVKYADIHTQEKAELARYTTKHEKYISFGGVSFCLPPEPYIEPDEAAEEWLSL